MSFVTGIFDNGALPTLERTIEFTEQRHRLIVDNIANINTPGHRPQDLDVEDFQAALRKNIRQRESDRSAGRASRSHTGRSGTATVTDAGIEVEPVGMNSNVLFHDGSNRDVERIMQNLAENTLAHNTALRFLQTQFDQLKTAIRERI